MRFLLLLLVVLVVGVLGSMSVFTVDPTEFAYVTQFGEPIAVYDGGGGDAGLHWRWPWPVQSVLRLDRRLQYIDLASADFSTFDKEGNTVDKILVVEAFVCWRILGKDEDKDAVDRFVRRLGTPEQARVILGQRVNGRLGAEIGELPMDDLISTKTTDDGRKRVDANMKKLRDTVRNQLQKKVREDYGIELVDVNLRRFNHPGQARDEILARIKSERQRQAEIHRSDGRKQAADILSASQQRISEGHAAALAKAKKIQGDARTEADLIRNRAHSQDPDFYVFLKKLENMHSILSDNKTLLLLSTHRPIFDLLFEPPRPGAAAPAGNGNGAAKNGPPQSKVDEKKKN